MATILTSTPFVNGTAMVASEWNAKYNLLYNELNGNIDNANIGTTAGVLESKLQFNDSGHDHSNNKAINIAASINTSGSIKGDMIYYTGTTWASLASGTAGQKLKYDYVPNTTLLVHFDGTDGQATYTAETGQVLTFSGNAQLDTSNKKFGISSLLLDGDADYVTLPDNATWDFGAGNFTWECYIYLNSIRAGTNWIYGQSEAASVNAWEFYIDGINNRLYADAFTASATTFQVYTEYTFVAGQWYHVAFVRSGNTPYFFINGVSRTVTTSTTISGKTLPDIGSTLDIGGFSLAGASHKNSIDGWIDEVRISKGVARWTANFTPSNLPYTPELQWA